MRRVLSISVLVVAPSLLAACGGDDTASSTDRPSVVVTTNVLGDVVDAAVGDQVDVEVVMPIGADPHTFAPSARQAEAMSDADLLVVNGAGFEAGLDDVIAAAAESGTTVFAFADAVDLLPVDPHAEPGDDEAQDDEEHDDEAVGDDHDESGDDPHLWTDPVRVADGVQALGGVVADLPGVDQAAVERSVAEYVEQLAALDGEIADVLADVPPEARVLVTNHEVFAYFADRYGFEVVGAVVPSSTTAAEASARGLDELAEIIERESVPAIFAETTTSTRLAEALADAVEGDVEVVELYTGSLGEEGSGAETYIGMMRTDARLVAEALAG